MKFEVCQKHVGGGPSKLVDPMVLLSCWILPIVTLNQLDFGIFLFLWTWGLCWPHLALEIMSWAGSQELHRFLWLWGMGLISLAEGCLPRASWEEGAATTLLSAQTFYLCSWFPSSLSMGLLLEGWSCAFQVFHWNFKTFRLCSCESN